ncbi:hypothetical protein EBU94_02550 [bacterium]|nr:hypothetical protein [bacterium]
MSGGRFDYLQYRFTEIVDAIEYEIKNNDGSSPDENHREWWTEPNNFSQKTISEFQKGITLIKLAQIYAQRIDWLLSGDDGEENFHLRLNKDLSALHTNVYESTADTAVTFIIKNIQESLSSEEQAKLNDVFAQALDIERSQIITAYNSGEWDCGCNGTAEEYYTRNYNTND